MNPLIKRKIIGRRSTLPPAAPTNISIGGSNGNTSRTDTLTNTVTAAANSIMVLTVATAEDKSADPLGTTITSVPFLKWEKKVISAANSVGNTEIYYAVNIAGGSITTTLKKKFTATAFSAVLYHLPNADLLLPVGSFKSITNQSLPNITIGTTRPNSILFMVTSDWNANDGTTRAYLDSATETQYDTQSTIYTAYHYYKITTSVGNYTEGMTLPVGTSADGTSILEIRGKAA